MKDIVVSHHNRGYLLTIGACRQRGHPQWTHDEQYYVIGNAAVDLRERAERKGYRDVFEAVHQEVIDRPVA